MHLPLKKTLLLALLSGALVAPPAMGTDVVAAGQARIKSLTLSKTRLKEGRATTVKWELTGRATTVFQVRRCISAKCGTSTPVSDELKRHGVTGLNTFRLRARMLSPGRYKVVGRTRVNSRRAFFRVVQ